MEVFRPEQLERCRRANKSKASKTDESLIRIQFKLSSACHSLARNVWSASGAGAVEHGPSPLLRKWYEAVLQFRNGFLCSTAPASRTHSIRFASSIAGPRFRNLRPSKEKNKPQDQGCQR